MASTPSGAGAGARRGTATLMGLAFVCTVFAALLIAPALPAYAGQASTGKLLFYPCTTCHPVFMVPGPNGTEHPSKPLPNGMKEHVIKLEIHDSLATGGADSCLVCHSDPTANPGVLKGVAGQTVDIKGDVSLVCNRCHEAQYKEFKVGTHGRHQASCVAAGCHDPHTPGYIYAAALPPFLGTGFQFQVLPVRVPFKPLMSPPSPPAIVTPLWFALISIAGFLVVVGIIVMLVLERSKR